MKFDLPEGATPLEPDEIRGLIPSIATQGELNEFEADNIVQGINWARRSRKVKKALLDQSTLRDLHKRMLGETWTWAGSYRTTQKNIGCESWQISTYLKQLLDDVEVRLEFKNYSPVEIAARFHHRLVWIHPFVNGNGRFARLATDLLCEQRGWPVPTWGSTDLAKQSEVRHTYIQALRAADGHDFALLQRFMYT